MNLQEVKNVFLPTTVQTWEDGQWLRFSTPAEFKYDYDFYKSMPVVLCDEEGNQFEKSCFNSDGHYVVYKPLKRMLYRAPGDW